MTRAHVGVEHEMPEPPVAPASIPHFQRRHWAKQADWQWLFRAGRGNDPKVKNHQNPGDKLLVTLAWRARGLGIKQVAKRTGRSHERVSAVCKQFGVVPRVVIPKHGGTHSAALWGDYVAQEITAQARAERAHSRAWAKMAKKSQAEYAKAYYHNVIKKDPELCLRAHIRWTSRRCARRTSQTSISFKDLIGCTMPEYRQFIEGKFRQGMSWQNYGSAWEIDHIKPLAAFDLYDEDELRKAAHYTNTQPLFVGENRRKSSKWLE